MKNRVNQRSYSEQASIGHVLPSQIRGEIDRLSILGLANAVAASDSEPAYRTFFGPDTDLDNSPISEEERDNFI